MNLSISFLLLLLLLFCSCSCSCCFASPSSSSSSSNGYSAIFNFGDSLADAGNLCADGIPPFLATARLPYGMTFFGFPTGRCSDGRLLVDFLGIPVPNRPGFTPTLFSSVRSIDMSLSVSVSVSKSLCARTCMQLRSSGCRCRRRRRRTTRRSPTAPTSPSPAPPPSTPASSRPAASAKPCGTPDPSTPRSSGSRTSSPRSAPPPKKLIAEGAVDLVVPGVLPMGCFPVYLTITKNPKGGYGSRSGCIRKFNTLSWVHNAMLRRAVEKLRTKYPAVKIVYADYYAPVIQFVLHAEKFGFYKQLPRACCGAPGQSIYNFNLTAKCGEPGAAACEDPATHWSWDGIHLTEAAYGHIARGWLNGSFADPPIKESRRG